MKILATGGAGFIGSHVLLSLARSGHKVALIDDFNDSYDPDLKRDNANISQAEIFTGDICDRNAIRSALAAFKPDAIIHLAAQTGVRASIQSADSYIRNNIHGTLSVLDEAKRIGIGRILFASSSSVYGNNSAIRPSREGDSTDSLESPYALTKVTGEGLCRLYANQHGLSISALRFFTVYGPRQRPDLAIARFARNISAGINIDVYGDGSATRDYTYIDDLTAGITAALYRQTPGFAIYNLGCGRPVKLKDIVTHIENSLQRKASINWCGKQQGDVSDTWADISHAKENLGYVPKVLIEEGIDRYCRWLNPNKTETFQ